MIGEELENKEIFREFEQIKKIDFQIELIKSQISTIKSQMEYKGVKYSDTAKNRGGYIDSFIENCVATIDSLNRKIIILESQKSEILDGFRKVLTAKMFKIVYYRHYYDLQWDDISKKVDRSKSNLYALYNEAKKLVMRKNYIKN